MSTAIPRPLRIVGVHGSPYSRKVLAALRYRRIPYAWIVQGSAEDHDLPSPRVFLLPQLLLENDKGETVAVTDSTPLLRRLEAAAPGRELRPADPVMALLDAIVEDWADEWLTKAMFHYRWAFEADAQKAARILPRWSDTRRGDDEIAMRGAMFSDRQIGRLGVVGSNSTTGPFIEDSYRRALAVLNARLTDSRFLLGERPAACDFAVYGQLTQLLAFDPTPSAIALAEAPRVVAWVDVVDELSGLEPSASDWIARDEAGGDSLRALLAEIGRVYVPFLLANARAVSNGTETVECTLDGHTWTQKPFPYQAKCLAWLREEHTALCPSDRAAADAILAGSGCDGLFA